MANIRKRFKRPTVKNNPQLERALRDGGDQVGSMWDTKVGGWGTAKFANETVKRREKNKRAKESRRKNRAR